MASGLKDLTSTAVLAFGLAVSACGRDDGGQLADAAGGASVAAPPAFFLAVMNQASTRNADAYKLVAAPAAAVDPATVRFCFDTVARCTGGIGPSLPGVAETVGDGSTVFLTDKFVKLAAKLNITVVAKDLNGNPVSAGVKLVAKGGAAPPPPPDAPTATAAGLGASPSISVPPAAVSPTSVSPTSASPTSASPASASPTSASPASASPTSVSPTSASPTTPTTASPTSASPTSASPAIPAAAPADSTGR